MALTRVLLCVLFETNNAWEKGRKATKKLAEKNWQTEISSPGKKKPKYKAQHSEIRCLIFWMFLVSWRSLW